MQFRFNRDVNQTYCLVLYSYLTFTDRVGVGGWLEKWGIKLSQLSTQLKSGVHILQIYGDLFPKFMRKSRQIYGDLFPKFMRKSRHFRISLH